MTAGLMLRSIADIAHSEGENLHSTEARVACMQVFALGGRGGEDQAAETGTTACAQSGSWHSFRYA